MTKIRAIAVDDEKQAREGLKALLKKDPEVELIACCSDGMEAIASIIKLRPALLFLDIQILLCCRNTCVSYFHRLIFLFINLLQNR